MKTIKPRALSLDALRGYAIITMVLSGQMILTHLPAWMAHAQMPPGKGFMPSIYGITWVDLVFPFFLFAMGAAFPFSIGSKIAKGISRLTICWNSFVRAAQLVFFAIFFQHMLPWVIDKPVTASGCWLSILSFAMMFLMFMDINIPKLKDTKYASAGSWAIKIVTFVAAYLLMKNTNFASRPDGAFDVSFSNIILIVLANMAFFGTLIYAFTWKKPIWRLAVLPFVMAVFLVSGTDGWVKDFFNYSPLPWAYKFAYLKYLFIVIPGSIAGEYLYDWINSPREESKDGGSNNAQAYLMTFISLAVIVCNVVLLFTRQLTLNLALTVALCFVCHFVLKMSSTNFSIFWKRLFLAGTYCLLLGLFFEAYEGGIRKDPSSYGYYFVTSGLAFFALIFFSTICDYFKCIKSTKFLVMAGQNPMIAYVTTSLVVIPLLTITHLIDLFEPFNATAFLGFLRGVIVTFITVLITMFFTKLKWFWRT